MADALAQLTIMMKQPPAPLEPHNRMMRRPPQHRLEYAPSVRERAKRRVAHRVDEVVRIARRVAEVVLLPPLMHPRRLEEPPLMIVRENRLPRLRRQDNQIPRRLLETPHIPRQRRDLRKERPLALARRLLRPQPRLVERRDAVRVRLAGHGALVALQLPAPEAPEVQERVARVRVHEGRGIDAEAPCNGLRVRHEGTGGRGADGDADAEDGGVVPRREEEVVLAVLERGVGGPELLRRPRHVLGAQHGAVVGDGVRGRQGRGREDVVVGHVVLVAVVVELDVCFAVVRGVDVDLALEDVG